MPFLIWSYELRHQALTTASRFTSTTVSHWRQGSSLVYNRSLELALSQTRSPLDQFSQPQPIGWTNQSGHSLEDLISLICLINEVMSKLIIHKNHLLSSLFAWIHPTVWYSIHVSSHFPPAHLLLHVLLLYTYE